MAYFLAKSEPSVYSIGDLERDGQTVWDGVKNAQAVAVIKTMQPGDTMLIYHSGGETAVVGIADILSAARPDPQETKSWVVDVRYRGRIEPRVSLRQVKESGRFADFNLVRHSRLSTMVAPQQFIDWLRAEHGAQIP